MRDTSIMIVGVGGQGTLLTSRILGNVGISTGADVKVSEVHGMSQRGGSVVTYVKMGEKVSSPIIEKGEADILLCFEELEALRWVDYAKKDASIIINTQRIDPMPVITGKAKYPENIVEKISAEYKNVVTVPALELAEACGSIKAVNVVMIGVLARRTGIPEEIWIESIRKTVKPQFVDMNIEAFKKGYNL
ncbi:MAG: indolepyruvate oxidoreductase subunit beta [Clostridiaceae bacterium]|jgi:indolepyruvate ferredoxin oxidoreductase beta subunit|nr:indolepyruvate oxidoreductase subunit beta [Bacillota bacterium]NLI39024.1 indolepyruvate oxidoreductase subunit beta [Clostridiaceae bacterium]